MSGVKTSRKLGPKSQSDELVTAPGLTTATVASSVSVSSLPSPSVTVAVTTSVTLPNSAGIGPTVSVKLNSQ